MQRSSLYYSKIMGATFGVLIPILETIRRREQLLDPGYFLHWFDDYLLGGFMLFAVWTVHKNPLEGQKFLAAAWGLATSGLFLSTVSQLTHPSDPSHLSSTSVALIKGAILLFAAVGLVMSLRKIS